MEFDNTLTILLTESLPNWAESAVAKLKGMANIQVVTVPQNNQPTVVLHYGDRVEESCRQYGYGRLGFWFFKWANSDYGAIDAAQRSAAAGLPLEVGLWVRYPDGRCECLYQSFGLLEPYAIKRCVQQAKAKAAYFPIRVLAAYSGRSELPVCKAEAVNLQSNKWLARAAEVQAILKKIARKLLYKEQWYVIAGVAPPFIPNVETVQWCLDSGVEKFWADPFPLEYQGRQWILVEQVAYQSWCGHLVVIELFADGRYGHAQPVMVTDKHQSYPFVFTWNQELYLLPESSASRNLVLWKCKEFPGHWQPVAELLTDVYIADSTLIEYQGHWWMFAAIAVEGACIHDELHVYYADSPLGPWQAHPKNPVKSDARNARPAGNLFVEDGILYRPAQDCGVEYGKAVVLNRIDRLDIQEFSETPIARLDASDYRGFLRTHTLSRSQHIWAVDGLRLLPRWRRNTGMASKF